MMSFVAGLMLGIAFYHLLPHAILTLPEEGEADTAVWWLMIGLLVMFVLLRAFHFHQHGPQHEHDHDHESGHHVHDSHDQNASPLSWAGVGLGLALHTIIDGIALGAAIQAGGMAETPAGLLGLGVFMAIVLHKPLDAMSIASLMIAGGWGSKARMVVNVLFSLMCPLGALLFFVGIDSLSGDKDFLVGAALAFSAGVFICISLSDLLPEVQFHSHDRAKLTMALFVGIAVAYAIGLLEPGHAHEPRHSALGAHSSASH
jgi:zinc and cadmium transporter